MGVATRRAEASIREGEEGAGRLDRCSPYLEELGEEPACPLCPGRVVGTRKSSLWGRPELTSRNAEQQVQAVAQARLTHWMELGWGRWTLGLRGAPETQP